MSIKRSSILTATISAFGGAALIFTLHHAGILGAGNNSDPVPADSSQQGSKIVKAMYQCPMHPQIIRDHPGTCPICGMTLVPIKDHSHGNDEPKDAIHIESAMIQSIGVKTVLVQESQLQSTLNITGGIEIDPERVAVVNARTMGWIESIPVGSEGLHVSAGQKLASFYSPDLVAAQEDFLQAMRAHDERLVASARKRLEVLGVAESIIDSIAKNGASLRSLPLQAPISGIILVKSVVQGQNVMPGVDLYRIADLSHVWAVGRAYPEDLANMRVGLEAQVLQQGQQGSPRTGRIIFIGPVVDPQTKTTEIRVDINNVGSTLFKPGLNADIHIPIVIGKGIAISAQAVIHTGERNVAIVALGKGFFAPRELSLGAKLGDSVQVLSGLVAGDSLVTSAQFLIDSESNLKKAVEGFRK